MLQHEALDKNKTQKRKRKEKRKTVPLSFALWPSLANNLGSLFCPRPMLLTGPSDTSQSRDKNKRKFRCIAVFWLRTNTTCAVCTVLSQYSMLVRSGWAIPRPIFNGQWLPLAWSCSNLLFQFVLSILVLRTSSSITKSWLVPVCAYSYFTYILFYSQFLFCLNVLFCSHIQVGQCFQFPIFVWR